MVHFPIKQLPYAPKFTSAFLLMCLLALSACATAAKILYPVNEDPLSAKEGAYQLDPLHANVIFSVSHFGFSFHHGRFNKIEGSLELDPKKPADSRVYIKLFADSIDTNSSELDQMLKAKSMFNSAEHPYVVFESERITLLTEKSATIDGMLTMAGTKQAFSLNATFIGSGTNPLSGLQTIGFSGKGSLKRSEYHMNEWLPFVGDKVSFTIEAEFFRSK